jgi:hypothetical protein
LRYISGYIPQADFGATDRDGREFRRPTVMGVNFGDRPFAYALNDEQYISLHAFLEQKEQE